MTSNIKIINGPNLNLLGEREKEEYGVSTLSEIKEQCEKFAQNNDQKLTFFQSNIEGEIVTWIQGAKEKNDGIIINAAGFTHTSVSIRDALQIFNKPKIELHISNIYNREEFRKKSLLSDVVNGGIFGLGSNGYILAIMAMHKILINENK